MAWCLPEGGDLILFDQGVSQNTIPCPPDSGCPANAFTDSAEETAGQNAELTKCNAAA
jgi:hypothetical protein